MNTEIKDDAIIHFPVLETILEELRGIREDQVKRAEQGEKAQHDNAERAALISMINSNLLVAVFGGGLTLPILSSNASDLARRLLVASFLFFGTNAISCLFWLLRLVLSDQTELREDLSPKEEFFLFLVGTVGHTLFNLAGLLLLAATTTTYSHRIGSVCVGFMGLTAIVYISCGAFYLRQVKLSIFSPSKPNATQWLARSSQSKLDKGSIDEDWTRG